MSLHQAIAWIEEKEAHILRVEKGLHHETTIHAPDTQATPTNGAANDSTVDDSTSFFFQIARALDTADEILIVGPSAAKLAFVKYMHKNDHAFDPRILGVETIDNPDDSRLSGYAKLYFTEGGPRRSGHGSGYRETL
jgi:stalled ribosome rescue protein Dom34